MGRKWTAEQRQIQSETQRKRWQHEKERMRLKASPPEPQSRINVSCCIRVNMDELAQLSGAQLSAFMRGVGILVAALK